jgi:S1-C subfamily serine protease
MPTLSSAQQLREAFRRVRSAVVIVHTGNPDDANSRAPGEVDVEGTGSGVLISKDGKILTAAHVIENETDIQVEFADGQRLSASVVASIPSADVALLKVDHIPSSANPATLGDSDALETGDDIFIVGAPYGLTYSLTVGRVSARRPEETRGGILSSVEFLQTDAVVNPGNSGGPVFNKEGQVVGIVSCFISDSADFRGVGFAATANSARALLLNDDAGRAGIEGVLVTGVVARALNLPQPAGFLVTKVDKDSFAEKVGLVGGQLDSTIDEQRLMIGGDVILGINGEIVGSDRRAYRTMIAKLSSFKHRDVVRFKILRSGKVLDLSLTVPADVTDPRSSKNSNASKTTPLEP